MQITQTQFYKKLLGGKGERLAAKYLKKRGYKIVEKNYRTKFAEADIIAENKDFLVFVEVKTRTSELYGRPADAVGYKKREKYIQTAEYFLLTNPEYREKNVRFDVCEILNDQINYIENAFYCD